MRWQQRVRGSHLMVPSSVHTEGLYCSGPQTFRLCKMALSGGSQGGRQRGWFCTHACCFHKCSFSWEHSLAACVAWFPTGRSPALHCRLEVGHLCSTAHVQSLFHQLLQPHKSCHPVQMLRFPPKCILLRNRLHLGLG